MTQDKLLKVSEQVAKERADLADKLADHRRNKKEAHALRLSESSRLNQNPVRKGKPHQPYSDKQKITALQTYNVTGSWIITSKESGIPYNYLRQLGMTQWWKDSIIEIKKEEDDVLDADLSGVIKDGVGAIKDRLKNGDWMWNSKEDKFVRKPLKGTDALRITTSLMDQRNVMRGKPTRITEQVSVSDRLAKLALEFENFQKGRTVDMQKPVQIDSDIVDVEPIEYSFDEAPTVEMEPDDEQELQG